MLGLLARTWYKRQLQKQTMKLFALLALAVALVLAGCQKAEEPGKAAPSTNAPAAPK